ncbi:hypothetical protein SNE40_023442 [Patella caerulea]|uniref:Polypeptide N-acetylgalactosaminyltransferase n=1 Tax=Patella caerulea TaxID=87958 RepID=A0AAN8FYH2_PATCE
MTRVRFKRHWLPLVLMGIPTLWLLAVLRMSFTFVDKSDHHEHISKRDSIQEPEVDNLNINHVRRRSRHHRQRADWGEGFNLVALERDEVETIPKLNITRNKNYHETNIKHNEKPAKIENGVVNVEEERIISMQIPERLENKDDDVDESDGAVHQTEILNPFLKRAGSEEPGVMVPKKVSVQITAGENRKLMYPVNTESNGPGENGAPVLIDPERLDKMTKRREYYNGLYNYRFNEFASNLISVKRALPDYRNQECKQRRYPSLPTVTIIICFYNEAWSTLLRTLHSAIDRAPPKLVKDIFLVDDNSDKEHLKTPLDEYVGKELPKVTIIRSKTRQGLVRARMMGVARATGDALVFLDSHVECFDGWLEPLLLPLIENPETVVTPIIEMIDSQTFGIASTVEGNIGSLNLAKMEFIWTQAPPRVLRLRKSPDDNYLSPTMAGGLFAITRDYFHRLGGYDEGIELWGSENLELSFKTWMCGGRILITPCSHIGHVFRATSPYLNEKQIPTLERNKARVAEVWLDQYKEFFFSVARIQPDGIGDITPQKQLRKDLKCKTFDWYIRNVYPELYIPGMGEKFGEIMNAAVKECIKVPSSMNRELEVKICNKYMNVWELTLENKIRYSDLCFDVLAGNRIVVNTCSTTANSQTFIATEVCRPLK